MNLQSEKFRLCDCPEEPAETIDFTYDSSKPHDTGRATNAHTHQGCRVYHKGLTCTISREERAMTKKGKDGFENIKGRKPGRKKSAAAHAKAAREAHLPGMEPKTIPSVHNAIEEYVDVHDRRVKLTELEAEKKHHLVQVMKKAGITEYNVDGHTATIEIGKKVKAGLDAVTDAR